MLTSHSFRTFFAKNCNIYKNVPINNLSIYSATIQVLRRQGLESKFHSESKTLPMNQLSLNVKEKDSHTCINCINCVDIDMHILFAALYNYAYPGGMAFFDMIKNKPMDREEAKKLLDRQKSFRFVRGIEMKIDFSNWPYVEPSEYEKKYGGLGTVENICKKLRTRWTESSIELKMVSEDRYHTSLEEFSKLAPYSRVRFTANIVQQLHCRGVPYQIAEGWHLFLGIDDRGGYEFIGSDYHSTQPIHILLS